MRQGAEFFRPAFEAFDNRATMRFVEALGVPLVCERGGRLFPASGKAWDVANALVSWVSRSGVEIRCHAPVAGLSLERGRGTGVGLESGAGVAGQGGVVGAGGGGCGQKSVWLVVGGKKFPGGVYPPVNSLSPAKPTPVKTKSS